MKKITFLVGMLFSYFWAVGQTCEQDFIIEGLDTNTVLTIESSELNCYGGTLNSVKILDAVLGSDFGCGSWYTFDIDIDGVVTSDVCYEDLLDMDVTGFTTITITSSDADNDPDQMGIGIRLQVEYTSDSVPNCDAVLTTPADGATDVNLLGVLSWSGASGGAGGYALKVGTTPGASDVVNIELGNVTTYDIPGLLQQGTEYFVTITPFNPVGPAVGCTEYSFTTVVLEPGNFCENAIVVDVLPFNAVDNTDNYEAVYYAGSPGATGCGSTNSYLNGNDVVYSYTSTFTGTMKIELTGAGNYTGIFVYGSCSDVGVSCLNGRVSGFTATPLLIEEFPVVTGTTYYIVISTWAAPQTTAYTLAITENTCTNGAATYNVVADCDENNSQFLVNVNVTDLGTATSMTISDNQGSAAQAVTAVGTFTFGPYPNNTPVIFTTTNDQDGSCFITSPTLNQMACPPANDNCDAAESLTVSPDLVCAESTSGTTAGATASSQSAAGVSGTPNNDVWYSFVAQNVSQIVTISNVVAIAPGDSTDMGMAVYNATGGCEALTLAGTSDPNTLILTGLVVNDTYMVRVYGWSSTVYPMTFNICITTPPAPPVNDTCAGAIDLTNETSPLQSTTQFATNDNMFVCNYEGAQIANTHPDVYYSIVVPSGSTLSIGQTTNDYDSANVVFYGDCENRMPIDCYDDSDEKVVEWANNTGEDQTVYWVQDGWSGAGAFTLAWSVIACTPAEATYKVVSNCEAGEEFLVEVDVTNLGSATSVSVSDDQGSEVQVLTAIGVVTFGPYANGTPVIFTVVNDQDENCTLTSPAMNQTACPPANDDCAGATLIVVDEQFCDGVNNNGTNLGATDSGEGEAECFNYGMNDVWFSFVVPATTATVDISTDFLGGTLVDTEIALYSGTCDNLVEEDCDQDSGTVILSNGSSYNSIISDVPVNAGETYYVRVSGYSATAVGSFCLDVSTNETLSTNEFETAGFKVYPNPVKDVLNLSYTQNISNVQVFNMLGQQVLTKSVDATQGQVDMSNLATGTYLVKVATDNQVKTIKVVKQ